MKEDYFYLVAEISLGIVFLLVMLIGLAFSIINVVQKGFKSYGIIVLGAIALLAIIALAGYLAEKQNPKSRFSKSAGKFVEHLIEGIIQLLSFSG